MFNRKAKIIEQQIIAAGLTQEMHKGGGGVDALPQHLQGVARQSEQGIYVAVVEIGQQLMGFLLHHLHQVPLFLPPHQGRGWTNTGRREQGVSGEETAP